MEINKQQIAEAKSWLQNNYYFANKETIQIDQDNDNDLFLSISERYEDETQISSDDFIELIDELKSSEVNSKLIKTRKRIIYSLDYYSDSIYDNIDDTDFEDDNIYISFIKVDILILILYVKYLDHSHKYFDSMQLPYFVEVYIKRNNLSNQHIENLVKSFLFESSNKLHLPLSIVKIGTHNNPEYGQINNTTEWDSEFESMELSDRFHKLKRYNPLMQDFIKSIKTPDLNLQFLGFFKILEHCGVILLQQDLYVNLKNRIELGVDINKLEDLQEIVNIVGQAKKNRQMEYIITSLFKQIKFTEYKNYLPEKLKKLLDNDIIKKLISFRNAVCHDKANYFDKEDIGSYISKEDEFCQLNLFMKKITYSTINWHINNLDKLGLKI